MASQEISMMNVFGYFIQDKKHESPPQFVPIGESDGGEICGVGAGMKIVASCNQGILCCVKKLERCKYQYYVGKPSTRQWQAIPNPRKVNDDEPSVIKGITVLPCAGGSLRFAIVRLTYIAAQMKWAVAYQCEIFDSKYWKWREIGRFDMRQSHEFIVNSPGVSANSSVHWLTSEQNVVGVHFVRKGVKYMRTPGVKDKYMKLVECADTNVKFGYVILTEEGLMELWLVRKQTYYIEKGTYSTKWCVEMEKNLKNHEDQVKYPDHAGFYNVDDNLEDLDKFRDFICYEKLLVDSTDTNEYTIRLDELNVAADVFRVRLDLKPINIQCPILSDAKSKSLRRRRGNKRKQLSKKKEKMSISFDCSFTSIVLALSFFFLLQSVLYIQ